MASARGGGALPTWLCFGEYRTAIFSPRAGSKYLKQCRARKSIRMHRPDAHRRRKFFDLYRGRDPSFLFAALGDRLAGGKLSVVLGRLVMKSFRLRCHRPNSFDARQERDKGGENRNQR